GDVAAEVGRDPLEPADRDRLSVDASAPAGRLARAIAGAAEDAGEDVGLSVEEIGLGVLALGDEADVLRHIGVRRACPLAIDDLVEARRILDVGGVHRQGTRQLYHALAESSSHERIAAARKSSACDAWCRSLPGSTAPNQPSMCQYPTGRNGPMRSFGY